MPGRLPPASWLVSVQGGRRMDMTASESYLTQCERMLKAMVLGCFESFKHMPSHASSYFIMPGWLLHFFSIILCPFSLLLRSQDGDIEDVTWNQNATSNGTFWNALILILDCIVCFIMLYRCLWINLNQRLCSLGSAIGRSFPHDVCGIWTYLNH